MAHPRLSPVLVLTALAVRLVGIGLVGIGLVGCGEDDVSAKCSEKLPLYNVRDGGLPEDIGETLAEEGCITLPAAPQAGGAGNE